MNLPNEIPGLLPLVEPISIELTLEQIDFFNIPQNRLLILQREGLKCFYCFRKLDTANHVIEHVVSRPDGNNSYRNVVAACRNCNNRKGDSLAQEFLRVLYRDGYLNSVEFDERLTTLERLRIGELKPDVS